MKTAVHAAVALAERQLAALRLDDIDGFLAGLDSYESACLALVALSSPGVGDEGRGLLAQLIAIDHELSAELTRAMGEVSARMASMRRGRNAAGAYFAAPGANVTGVREG